MGNTDEVFEVYKKKMITEEKDIDNMLKAYHRGYRLGFLDGKDVGYEEGLDAGLDQTR